MLTVLYINLDLEIRRRAHIETALGQQGITAYRIPGVESRAPIDGFDFASSLTAPERGCYVSHMRAWNTLLASDDAHALIVEDDALIPPNLAALADRVISVLPAGWDIVHLYGDEGRAVKRLRSIGGGHDLVRYSRAPPGAVAYLISRSGAAKLRAPRTRSWPIDTDLRRPWHYQIDCYGIAPPVVGHSTQFASTLAGKRSRGRRGIKLTNPLHSPRAAVWNIRKLGLLSWVRCLALNTGRKIGLAAQKILLMRTAIHAAAAADAP